MPTFSSDEDFGGLPPVRIPTQEILLVESNGDSGVFLGHCGEGDCLGIVYEVPGSRGQDRSCCCCGGLGCGK